jgi:hypothetical protein
MNFKTRSFGYALMVALIAFAASSVDAQTRVYFARGATRATVRGYLRGIRDEANYILKAKAGQHMRVEIRGRGATRGTITFPSGQGDGGPGGVVFDGILPDNGDYRIRVTESSMAEAWRGNFTLIIDVTGAGGLSEPKGRDNRDLISYVGRYPSELFRGEPDLRTRLRKLLGANYQMFFDRLQTEMPIESDGNTLIARGCMAHQCTIEEAIMAINLGAGTLHVAIKSDRFGGRFNTFSENKATIPAALTRAMRQ